jgi:hypothetical protein
MHPKGEVDIINIDRTIGHWTTTRRSGALQSDRVRSIQLRVRALLEAVKVARETANSVEVQSQTIGASIFGYLFGEAPNK